MAISAAYCRQGYIKKINTLVEELKSFLPAELGGVKNRSRAMVTCYPPGSRYTKHVDNGGRMSNGRRLTTLLYLNEDWAPGDGGCVGCSRADFCPSTRNPIARLGGRVGG